MASEKPSGLPVPYGADPIDAFLVPQGRRSIRTGFLGASQSQINLLKRSWKRRGGLPRLETAGRGILVIRSLEIREKIVGFFKTQMRDKNEIEEPTCGRRRRVNAGVDFRHAPVHVLVLGEPRTNEAFPCAQSWTSGKRTFTAA